MRKKKKKDYCQEVGHSDVVVSEQEKITKYKCCHCKRTRIEED